MRYRMLGNTDLSVSELSLGTVALGMPYGMDAGSTEFRGAAPPSDQEATRLVRYAIERGISFFDTARAYGRSEEILGPALTGQRSKVLIATKVAGHDEAGNMYRGHELGKLMAESLHTSLKLLQTDYVDLLMLHSASTDLLRNSDAIDLLISFKTQGKARFIGASTYGAGAPQIAIAQGVDALQVAYNVLDQRMADAVFPLAAEAGVGIIVRSVFLKGVLSSRAEFLPARLAILKAHSAEVKRAAAGLIPPLSRIEAALKFVLAQKNIATALVGVRDIAELETSLAIAGSPRWSDEIIEQFKRLRCDKAELLDPSEWGIP